MAWIHDRVKLLAIKLLTRGDEVIVNEKIRLQKYIIFTLIKFPLDFRVYVNEMNVSNKYFLKKKIKILENQ